MEAGCRQGRFPFVEFPEGEGFKHLALPVGQIILFAQVFGDGLQAGDDVGFAVDKFFAEGELTVSRQLPRLTQLSLEVAPKTFEASIG